MLYLELSPAPCQGLFSLIAIVLNKICFYPFTYYSALVFLWHELLPSNCSGSRGWVRGGISWPKVMPSPRQEHLHPLTLEESRDLAPLPHRGLFWRAAQAPGLPMPQLWLQKNLICPSVQSYFFTSSGGSISLGSRAHRCRPAGSTNLHLRRSSSKTAWRNSSWALGSQDPGAFEWMRPFSPRAGVCGPQVGAAFKSRFLRRMK